MKMLNPVFLLINTLLMSYPSADLLTLVPATEPGIFSPGAACLPPDKEGGAVAAFSGGSVFLRTGKIGENLPDTAIPRVSGRPVPVQGFASVTHLEPVPISSHLLDKPQAKLWTHAGKWWTVLPTAGGTKIFRLDGTTWTDVLTLTGNGNAKAECRVAGNVVHILLFRGRGIDNSYLVSVEYDPVLGTYKLWKERKSIVTLIFEPGAETATLAMDGKGRMWIASESGTDVLVRWSDAPYTAWSAPVSIASGIAEDDICALAPLQGKIGVLWSNQNAKRFGFKTHADGADPADWSADELPAARTALEIKHGVADDHLNLVAGSDGTLYCAVKTGYDTPGYPKLALLVRRPSGDWDDLHPVTFNEGTRPVVLLNEAMDLLKVVYTSQENGGEIRYQESAASSISFSRPKVLITGSVLYNYVSTTHQPYTKEIVILANDITSVPYRAVSVLGIDGPPDASMPGTVQTGIELQAFPNPFPVQTVVSFSLPEDGQYMVTMYDSQGGKMALLGQGVGEAGRTYMLSVNNSRLSDGLYFIQLRTRKGQKTLKIVKRR